MTRSFAAPPEGLGTSSNLGMRRECSTRTLLEGGPPRRASAEMTEHDLSPEHERVARQALESIRAAIAAGELATTEPPEGAFEDEDVS
jgi:hypothetical protein